MYALVSTSPLNNSPNVARHPEVMVSLDGAGTAFDRLTISINGELAFEAGVSGLFNYRFIHRPAFEGSDVTTTTSTTVLLKRRRWFDAGDLVVVSSQVIEPGPVVYDFSSRFNVRQDPTEDTGSEEEAILHQAWSTTPSLDVFRQIAGQTLGFPLWPTLLHVVKTSPLWSVIRASAYAYANSVGVRWDRMTVAAPDYNEAFSRMQEHFLRWETLLTEVRLFPTEIEVVHLLDRLHDDGYPQNAVAAVAGALALKVLVSLPT